VTSVPAPGDPRRLARIGYLLYGAQHIEYLSRILGVDRKTVYRWRRGVTPVPAYVWEPLKVALMKRRTDIGIALEGIDNG
jgi:hypothetical protein